MFILQYKKELQGELKGFESQILIKKGYNEHLIKILPSRVNFLWAIFVKPSFFCETFPANFEYQLILYYHKHNTLSLKLCGSIVYESRKEFWQPWV